MSKAKLSIQYFPALETPEELQEQLPRACWYLNALDPVSIIMPTLLTDTKLQLAEYYDQSIVGIYAEMMKAAVFVFPRPEQVRLEDADVVVCWKGKGLLGDKLKKLEEQGVRVFDVDRKHRMEGSLYIDIVDKMSGGQKEAISYGQGSFQQLVEKYEETENAYIFCTGPSVAEYSQYRYDNGLSIVCNSVIHDHELMDYVRPSLHVFADPIFHFGCSKYASEFRRSLVDASSKYQLTHIIPLKYWSLFIRQFPELVDCSFPIPFDQKIPVNYSLGTDFRLKTTDNILTFLMLPLAGSLANNIHLLGCDGRPLSEDDYFWKHNEKTQFVDEMESIQLAHPSFFKLDYNEYYVRHCERLEEYFLAGEALGKKFRSLSFSHIPALIAREDQFRFANEKSELLVSINPDLTDDFGHFFNMDRRIRERLETDVGFVSLGAIDQDMDGGLPDVIPTFRDNTWHVRDVGRDSEKIEQRFKNELIRSAINMRRLAMKKNLYMYTADIAHLNAMVEGRKSFAASEIHLHVNLFYTSFDLFLESFSASVLAQKYKKVFDAYNSLAKACITLYVESPIVQQRLLEMFGVETKLWPMIGVTDVHSLESAVACAGSNQRPVVFFPASTQFAKGADIACEAIIRYNETFGDDVDFVLREMLNDRQSANAQLRVMLDAVAKYENVELVSGAVSDQDYARLYARADVVVIPYRRASFYARTSAAVVDSLYFACPVLVADDTWLSSETKKFDQQYTFADGDDYALVRTLRGALLDRKKHRKMPSEHRDRWRELYGAQSLVDAVTADQQANAVGSPNLQIVEPKIVQDSNTPFTVQARSPYQPLGKDRFHSLQSQAVSLGEVVTQLTEKVLGSSAELSRVENSLAASVSEQISGAEQNLALRVASQISDIEQNVAQTVADRVTNVEQQLVLSISEQASQVTLLQEKLNELTAPTDLIGTAVDAVEGLKVSISELQMQSDELTSQLDTHRSNVDKSLLEIQRVLSEPRSNRDLYQRFSRQLSGSDLSVFVKDWFPKLGLDLKPHVLAYEAELICEAEKRCAGRLASSIQDALLRSLVARAVDSEKLEYLEIGTLFGINLCTVHELTKYEFAEVSLTSIDPLENYYQQGRDVLTGLPINSEVVDDNVRSMNIDPNRIRFIQLLSTDLEAVKLASERVYNCILIDGDHSYEGVKNDHEQFSSMLCSGGYLMVDDYGAEEWPDVTRYVDETIKLDSRFEFVGSGWRTAVFRAK